MARASTTADVFNAIAETRRRDILDALVGGEKPVGAIVDELKIAQPQVSKHLRILSDVGLVGCRADGRCRLYRLNPSRLRPLSEWVAKYEVLCNQRLDRLDDYLGELQRRHGQPDLQAGGPPWPPPDTARRPSRSPSATSGCSGRSTLR